MAIEIVSVEFEWHTDEDPDPSYLDQEGFETRRAAYQAGEFYFTGCQAVASISIDGVLQTISSGGLWGIESDCGPEHRTEVEANERAELIGILAQLGIAL